MESRSNALFSPNYFMSPSSSNQIITLLRTCKESHSIVKKNYTLLFPPSARSSSTWFSFSVDFLYLDFGSWPHGLRYTARDFTSSIPDPSWYVHRPECTRYPRPKFNSELLKSVQNLAISISFSEKIDELVLAFPGVKVLVLADQLFSICHESSEELVWLSGQLGDERSSLTQLDTDKLWHESEMEKVCRHVLRDLPIWLCATEYIQHKDYGVCGITGHLQKWRSFTTSEMPIVGLRSIVTAKTKKLLIDICGSEDNFRALSGIDIEYIKGKHEYSGSLNLYQQLEFLELMLARFITDFDTTCPRVCATSESGEGIEKDILLVRNKIDMLLLEVEQQ